MDCLPAFIAAAFFTALIVVDMTARNTAHVGFHITSGVLCVLGIFALCTFFGPMAGWVFLSIPLVVLLIGGLHSWSRARKDALFADNTTGSTPAAEDEECECPKRPRCGSAGPVIPSGVASIPVVPKRNNLDSCTPVPQKKKKCVCAST